MSPPVDPWEVTGPEDAGAAPFTREWWARLPRCVREADRVQRPIPVPLLRFLNGVGAQADEVRELVWSMWSGDALTPHGAGEDVLEWMGYLMGMGKAQRSLPAEQLRDLLARHIEGGTHNVGTRTYIADAVRPFLVEGAKVQVRAAVGDTNTLVIGVNEGDILDSPEELMRRLRLLGVVPAGHALRVQDVRNTWDQWELAAGTTWDEVETNIHTWEDSDTAGVELH